MVEVDLTEDELEHIERVHRNGRDPKTKRVFDSILRRANDVLDGKVLYQTICNHYGKRDCTEEERQKYKGQTEHAEYICEDCGTVWDYYGRKL